MANKFFITTPIYYVNDRPHIGTAYTTLLGDAIARSRAEDVFYLTGTDEHGLKIEEAAKAASQSPEQYADEITADFQKNWEALNIKYSAFARTTDETHIKKVQALVQKIYDQGDIEKGNYHGLYCVKCEEYKTRNDLIEIESQQCCAVHKTPVEELSEEVYFFNLPKYESQIKEAIESEEFKILPDERRNEVLSFINQGLEKVAISRQKEKVGWGIPLPWDENHTIYVWIDALFNYVTFGGENWPADLQLMSKDILRFHAIIWPALLLAADLPLPKAIYVHGYFTVAGEKMSKSRGNVLRPEELIVRYGVDATRYLLLSALPFASDGNVSLQQFDRKYKSDLVNGIGNLVQRVLVFAQKNDIACQINESRHSEAREFYMQFQVAKALESVMKMAKDADQFIDSKKPWQIKDPAELEPIIQTLVDRLYLIADGLKPVMPTTSNEILRQVKSCEPKVLFPRLEQGTRKNEQ